MSVRAQWIEFDQSGDTGKTTIWNIVSVSPQRILGQIKWYAPWRQYCFFPAANTVFNNECMDLIQAKITELMGSKVKP